VPYAGASAFVYYKWKPFLNNKIKLHPVELSGRGTRRKSRLYDDFASATEDIYRQIKDKISDNRYALFGHSMGCWLVYELYYRILEDNKKTPSHIFLSGRRAPHHVVKDEVIFHNLPLEEFKEKVVELGGMPPELLSDPKMMNLFLPVIISDFKITEKSTYKSKKEKIDCPIHVFSGRGDNVSAEELSSWEDYSNIGCNIHEFDGDHFFPFKNPEDVVKVINSVLFS
jgi:surfactin synthase thioesterase subunit